MAKFIRIDPEPARRLHCVCGRVYEYKNEDLYEVKVLGHYINPDRRWRFKSPCCEGKSMIAHRHSFV